MRKSLFIILYFGIIANLLACGEDEKTIPKISSPQSQEDDNNNSPSENKENMKLQITIGTTKFTATLQDNATAKAFRSLLPITIVMIDHNENEKYYDLSSSLPIVAQNINTIHNGDIMLYGSNTLVVFYKTFSTSYSYTRIGNIDGPSRLNEAIGSGNVTVIFEKL